MLKTIAKLKLLFKYKAQDIAAFEDFMKNRSEFCNFIRSLLRAAEDNIVSDDELVALKVKAYAILLRYGFDDPKYDSPKEKA